MKNLVFTKENHVAVITIKRPPANALSSQVIEDISLLLDEVKDDDEIKVVLLHGDGRFFSAGADIKEFTNVQSGDDFSKLAVHGQQTFEKVERFPKPIIAAIHGAALGGGLELAMACHIRLVSNTAKVGLPELKLGLIPGFAGTLRLPRYVGIAKAAEMLFTSEPISGEEAVKWGLANHSYPEEELLVRAKEMAIKIAKQSPLALKAAIEQLQFSKLNEYDEGIKAEAKKFGELFRSEDSREGIQAFLEKREPKFKGK